MKVPHFASSLGGGLKDAFFAATYLVCTKAYLGQRLADAMVVQDDWELDRELPRIRRLIKARPNLAFNDNGHHALACAAAHQCNEAVRLLLDAGVAPDYRDRDGRTHLSISAICGRQAVAVMLLDKGAVVDVPDDKGVTPLMYAASSHPEMVELLLARGASLHLRDHKGRTALDVANAPPEHTGLTDVRERCRQLIVTAKEREDRQAREHAAYLTDGLPVTRPLTVRRPLSLTRR